MSNPASQTQHIIDYLDSKTHDGDTLVPIARVRAMLTNLRAELTTPPPPAPTDATEFLYMFSVSGNPARAHETYRSLAEAIEHHGPTSDLPTGEWVEIEPLFDSAVAWWTSTIATTGEAVDIRKMVARRASR